MCEERGTAHRSELLSSTILLKIVDFDSEFFGGLPTPYRLECIYCQVLKVSHIAIFAYLLSWLSLIMMITPNFYASQSIYAQVFCGKSFLQEFCGNRTQQWVDSEHNVRIIFTLLPTDPIIGNVTQLKFSVEDLKSGSLLKNLSANIVLTKNPTPGNTQQTSDGDFSTINNITAPNGTFSIKYEFLQEGTHQILLRVDSNNFSALALFHFIVSLSQ